MIWLDLFFYHVCETVAGVLLSGSKQLSSKKTCGVFLLSSEMYWKWSERRRNVHRSFDQERLRAILLFIEFGKQPNYGHHTINGFNAYANYCAAYND